MTIPSGMGLSSADHEKNLKSFFITHVKILIKAEALAKTDKKSKLTSKKGGYVEKNMHKKLKSALKAGWILKKCLFLLKIF